MRRSSVLSGRKTVSDSGAAAVEFALILPLFLLFTAGIVDLGRLLYYEIAATNAAREGVRMIAVGLPDEADERASASIPEDLKGAFGFPAADECDRGDPATYTVVADFAWILLDALAPIPSPVVSATASMRCGG